MASAAGNIIGGAAAGAGIGTMLGGPVGTAIGAGVGALGTGIAELVAAQKRKKALARVGLSIAEREQMAAGQQQAAAQQGAAQQREVQRLAMGSGATPFAGQAAALQRDIGAQAGEAGAQARLQADALSQQIAEAQRQEIMGRFDQSQAARGEAVQGAMGTFMGVRASEQDKARLLAALEQMKASGMDIGSALKAAGF